jgi:hypothetical protein
MNCTECKYAREICTNPDSDECGRKADGCLHGERRTASKAAVKSCKASDLEFQSFRAPLLS